MSNPELFELNMSRTNFHSPKDVRAIEVRLYILLYKINRGYLFFWRKWSVIKTSVFSRVHYDVDIECLQRERKTNISTNQNNFDTRISLLSNQENAYPDR